MADAGPAVATTATATASDSDSDIPSSPAPTGGAGPVASPGSPEVVLKPRRRMQAPSHARQPAEASGAATGPAPLFLTPRKSLDDLKGVRRVSDPMLMPEVVNPSPERKPQPHPLAKGPPASRGRASHSSSASGAPRSQPPVLRRDGSKGRSLIELERELDAARLAAQSEPRLRTKSGEHDRPVFPSPRRRGRSESDADDVLAGRAALAAPSRPAPKQAAPKAPNPAAQPSQPRAPLPQHRQQQHQQRQQHQQQRQHQQQQSRPTHVMLVQKDAQGNEKKFLLPMSAGVPGPDGRIHFRLPTAGQSPGPAGMPPAAFKLPAGSATRPQVPEADRFKPPSLPGPPSFTAIEARCLQASWPAPKDLTRVVGYVLEMAVEPDPSKAKPKPSGGKKRKKSSSAAAKVAAPEYRNVYSGPKLSAQIKRLDPGVTYLFRAAAVCDKETGPATEPSRVRTAIVPPGRCAAVELRGKTKTVFTLKWDAPPDVGGGAIASYQLFWDTGDGARAEPDFEVAYSGPERRFKLAHTLGFAHACRFYVTATNEVGTSPLSATACFLTTATVPGRPDPPELRASDVDRLELAWTEPAANGAAVSEYKLEMNDPTNDYGFQPCYQGPENGFTKSKLRRNLLYTFRLSASNAVGQSPTSTEVQHRTTPALPSPPSQPEAAGKPTMEYIKLRWAPADDGGSEVLAFRVEMDGGRDASPRPEPASDGKGPAPSKQQQQKQQKQQRQKEQRAAPLDDQFRQVYEGSEAVCEVVGLRPGHVYAFRVACSNLSARRARQKSSSISVAWAEPAALGGAAVTEYRLEVCSATSPEWVEVYIGLEAAYTAAELAPGLAYRFRAAAKSRAGWGPWSGAVECETNAALPTAPPSLSSVGVKATSARLTWSAAQGSGAPILGYRLQCRAAGAEFRTSYEGPDLKCTVTGLLPAAHYDFRVQGQNKVGWSAVTVLSDVVTAPAVPLAPGGVVVDGVTAGAALVQWLAPSAEGSPVATYGVEVNGKVTTVAAEGLSAQPSLPLEGLPSSTVFRVRVRAVNAVGPGPYSKAQTFQTRAVPPLAPRLELANAAPTSLKLKWSFPKRVEVLESVVEMRLGSGPFKVVYTGPGKSCKVAKLLPHTQYAFRMQCSNEAGPGAYGPEVELATLGRPMDAPGPPQVALGEDEGEVLVSWPRLPADAEGVELHMRRVAQGANASATLEVGGRERRITVSSQFAAVYEGPGRPQGPGVSVLDLEEGLEYEFKVRVQAAGGKMTPLSKAAALLVGGPEADEPGAAGAAALAAVPQPQAERASRATARPQVSTIKARVAAAKAAKHAGQRAILLGILAVGIAVLVALSLGLVNLG